MGKRDRERRLPQQLQPKELLQFWEARVFREAWEDLKLSSDDLLDVQTEIILAPKRAPVVQGTGGLRKLRFSPERWPVGKSGALRVCYVYFEDYGEVLLVLVYPKSEKENLDADDKKAVRQLIERQRAAYAKRTLRGGTVR
jgi:hypothetical protein